MSRAPQALSDADTKSLRAALEARRAALLLAHAGNISAATHPEGQLTDPMDMALRATEEAERLGLAAQERRLLFEIERALAKLDAGTYGVSELSGELIPIERLRAVPWARRTIEEEESRRRR